MRVRMFQLVQRARPGDTVSRAYDIFIVAVAVASILPLMFRPEDLSFGHASFLTYLDVATAYLLAFDYLMRWMTHDIKTGRSGWRAFARYPFAPMAIIDLLAILPSLGVLPENFMFLRVLRVVRIFRYWSGLSLIANVFFAQRRTLLSVLAVALAYIFVSALVMFVNEPQAFGDFFDALYWSTTALTTVGYGDIHPLTDAGKAVSMISSLFGIAIIALPAGVVTGGFLEEVRRAQHEDASTGAVFTGSASPIVAPVFLAPHGRDGGAPVKRTPCSSARAAGDALRDARAKRERRRRVWRMRHAARAFRSFLQGRPRVVAYAVAMTACFALNIALYGAASALGLPLWLDTAGTALAAMLLEPAAALVVGFANNLVIAIQLGSAGDLLYYALSAVVALSYGVLMGPGKKTTWRSAAAVIALTAVGGGLLSVLIAWAVSAGQITASEDRFYYSVLSVLGAPEGIAAAAALMVSKLADATAVFAIASFGARAVRGGKFDPLLWIAERETSESFGTSKPAESAASDAGGDSVAAEVGGDAPSADSPALSASLSAAPCDPSSGLRRKRHPACGALAPGGRAAALRRRKNRAKRG